MRFSTTKSLRYLPIIALASTVLALAFGPKASVAASGQNSVGDIRISLYYLTDTGTRSEVASTIPGGGIDYTIFQSTGTSRSNLGVDYIDRSSGGTSLQIIPVTIDEQYYHTLGGTSFSPYGEAGLGVYFVQLQEENNSKLLTQHSETSLGGFIGGGVDLTSSLFFDVRYHLVGTIQGQNPSGLQFSLGLRF